MMAIDFFQETTDTTNIAKQVREAPQEPKTTEIEQSALEWYKYFLEEREDEI